MPALIKWLKDKKGCVFFTEASINLADDQELLDMMAKAGFDFVFIGIESPDEACLMEYHKNQNKNCDFLQSVKIILHSGLQVMGGFIVGFNHDTPSIFQRQIDFIQKSGIVTAMVGMLQPRRELDSLTGFNGKTGWSVNFPEIMLMEQPISFPKWVLEKLLDGYRAIMKQIYSPNNFYPRVRTFLAELKMPEITIPLDFQRLLAFFRAGFRLGVWGKERFHYWYLLLWTLIRKPRMMPLAVTLATYGHHYRRICERYIL